MNTRKTKHCISPIPTALGFKQEKKPDNPIQPVRRDYSGLPKTGYVRISQLARNPKNPEAPAPIPVSPVTIWRWVAAGTFPAPTKLSGNVTAWDVGSIRIWLDQQAGK